MTATGIRRGSRWLCGILVITGLLLPLRPASGDVTPAEVKAAVDKAIAHIKSTQKGDGAWQDYGRLGGSTALNALALLNAGLTDADPAVSKAIAVLDKTPNTDTYIVSLKAMVYRYADAGRADAARKHFKELQAAGKWLIDAQLGTGTWGYNAMKGADPRMMQYVGDNSNTQFALLGLHEAALGGVAVPKEVWKKSEDHFLNTQLTKDGGWQYRADERTRGGMTGYGSMTCAGIASLYITGNQLDVAQESSFDAKTFSAPKCGEYRQNKAIADGLQWMARNFRSDSNPGNGGAAWRMYYLYAMERVGMISGLKFFGSHDWYREGAETLVDIQRNDGSFPQLPYDTAFALLFLAKGNKPVLINKLQWGTGSEWNQDRGDIEHLVQFVNTAKNDAAQKFVEQPVAWQTVNLKAPLVDLLDAPILFFNGHAFPKFSDADRKKLKDFIDQGGTILAEACCSRREFADGFTAFAREAWPEYVSLKADDQSIFPLSVDHPIFNCFYQIKENKWDLRGIQVGCRTSVIFAPRDLSCLWEQHDPKNPLTDEALKLGVNIAAYATGLERLKDKLERTRVAEKQGAGGRPGEIVRGALHIGVLAHDKQRIENLPDPEAITKFSEHLRDVAKIDVVSQLLEIQPEDPELLNHPIMFMTGHKGFSYTDDQLKGTRTWLDRGGFLYANACCGRDAAVYNLPGDPQLTGDFGSSFRKMVADIYKDRPEARLVRLPANHPIAGGARGFLPVGQVSYRAEFEKKLLAANKPAHDLLLEGVTVDDRLVIVYSPYAVTCGLEDHKCFNCRGLVTKDAFDVSTNVILYVLSH